MSDDDDHGVRGDGWYYDPTFTPMLGVGLDPDTGMMLLEHCVTCETCKFPVERLDEVIDQLHRFRRAYRAGELR